MHQHWSTIKKLIWLNANLANGSVLETVTGISPLLLTNAIAGNIVSLKQIGKCVQASDPTPDNPIDIMCNNGALRMVDDELPDGYKRIESIGFDGDFHYITNEKLYGSDEITITLDNTKSSGQNVFGSYSGTSSGTKNYSLFVYGAGSSSNSYLRYGETLYRPRYGNGNRTLVYGPNGTSGFLTDVSMTPDEFETDDVAWIGMLPNSSSPHFTGTIVGNILIGDRLKYIPCERVSDGAIGYYEPNTSVFLEPSGEGTPVKGAYDGSHYQLEIVGTPEVLMVGNDLVDHSAVSTSSFVRAGNASESSPKGSVSSGSGWCCTDYIPVQPETTYRTVVKEYNAATGAGLCFFEEQTVESCISGVTTQKQGSAVYDFTTPENCHYLRFSWKMGGATAGTMYKLSEVQTASVVNLFGIGDYVDTQDIISGAVRRNCGVVVFDGTEDWELVSTYFRLDGMFEDAIPYSSDNPAIVCTHFLGRQPKTSASGMNDGDIKLGYTSTANRLYLKYEAMADAAALKAYLAEQYAAGTPVTVVYPVENETTERTTAQALKLARGNNTIAVTAEIDGIELEAQYHAANQQENDG